MVGSFPLEGIGVYREGNIWELGEGRPPICATR